MEINKRKGISLIVLVITIIVIIILAGTVILSLSSNNPIAQSQKAVFQSDVGNFQTELDMYIIKQFSTNKGAYDPKLLQADSSSITYDITMDTSKSINDLIPSLAGITKYNGEFTVENGKLVFLGSDVQQQSWAKEVIIPADSVPVNKPILAAGMTPKKWNGSTWETVINPETDTSWYNYTSRKWANAQTSDGSMWVWIPRYEYKITTPHTSTSETIEINFLNDLSTTATSGYTIHPAFTFGSTELAGIWVAKFEASGSTSAVDVKPGVSAITNTTVSNIFTACRNMETNSRYGWGTTGTGIDTHLIKNVEWGAVAYLTQSVYGKDTQVATNSNSGYYTGAGEGVSYISNTEQSTTRNVYGIYDMSGGVYEYTAAYVQNGNSNLTLNGLNLINAASQYKDVYVSGGDTQDGNYSSNSTVVGDAVYETSNLSYGASSWYNAGSDMPFSSSPFFARGGVGYPSVSAVGTFSFNCLDGTGYLNYGFRPVVLISGAL